MPDALLRYKGDHRIIPLVQETDANGIAQKNGFPSVRTERTAAARSLASGATETVIADNDRVSVNIFAD